MKVTQEKLPASQIGLEIEITPEITKQKYEQVIKNLTKTVNVPGFRKGKAPRNILLQQLGSSRIKATALQELIEECVKKAIEEESIPALGQPELKSSFDELMSQYVPGEKLTFAAVIDVEPEVILNKYTELQIKAEEVKFNPEKVDNVLKQEQLRLADLVPVEGRPAQLDDVAVIDFKGVIAKAEGDDPNTEPTPIEGGSGEDFQVELQEDKFIPGFISGIVGMTPGETKEVSAQFPEGYTNEDLSGKPALFTITLKELKTKEPPELDDDFAQEVSDFDTLEELRASLTERYQKEADDQTQENKQEALLKELINHVDIDLPATLIEQEVDAMLQQTAMKLAQQGLDVKKLFTPEIIPQLRERSHPEAIERLKRSLALREIGKKEAIAVAEGEINARVKELIEQYSEERLDVNRLSALVEEELLTKKIIDWLLEHSSVELVPEGSLAKQSEEEKPEE